jgi:hypothetical protein
LAANIRDVPSTNRSQKAAISGTFTIFLSFLATVSLLCIYLTRRNFNLKRKRRKIEAAKGYQGAADIK